MVDEAIDSDRPDNITDLPPGKVNEEEATRGYSVTDASERLGRPTFIILDDEKIDVMSVMVDSRGGIEMEIPSIQAKDDVVMSFAEQYFKDLHEDTLIDSEGRKTRIYSSAKPGLMLSLSAGDETTDLVISIEDYRLKDMPNPLRPLVSIIGEMKAVPERVLEETFSKVQALRRSMPGHI